MTREQMIKLSIKPYMRILYQSKRTKEEIECMLISINFDDEIMELQPYGDNYYQQSFFTSISNCFISKKMFVATKGKLNMDVPILADNKQQENFKTTLK